MRSQRSNDVISIKQQVAKKQIKAKSKPPQGKSESKGRPPEAKMKLRGGGRTRGMSTRLRESLDALPSYKSNYSPKNEFGAYPYSRASPRMRHPCDEFHDTHRLAAKPTTF